MNVQTHYQSALYSLSHENVVVCATVWQAISSKEIKRCRKGALGSDGMMTKLAVATGQLPLLSHWRQKYMPATNAAKRLEMWLREANGQGNYWSQKIPSKFHRWRDRYSTAGALAKGGQTAQVVAGGKRLLK